MDKFKKRLAKNLKKDHPLLTERKSEPQVRYTKDIYKAFGGGHFGDHWASVCYLLALSERTKQVVRMSKSSFMYSNPVDIVPLYDEMLPVLDTSGSIKLVDGTHTRSVEMYEIKHNVRIIPTKIRWKPNKSKLICYQFDGQSPGRSPPPDDLDEVMYNLKSRGYELVRVGKGISKENNLEECVKLLSKCRVFIGADSGLSHVCHNVGAPVVLYCNPSDSYYWHILDMWHKFRHYDVFLTMWQLQQKVMEFMMS